MHYMDTILVTFIVGLATFHVGRRVFALIRKEPQAQCGCGCSGCKIEDGCKELESPKVPPDQVSTRT